ncbi:MULTISPECIES: hypothetical protein [Sutcliffiella]|uniref:hypothetical protein n=1 Tax=Sutcliffiella TaxID=2837511 RepID=UPI0022DE4F82|nr:MULTISPECIES: hypothetical protein [Sutcliffiella]MED4014541.1 hypothetical protein [Sutcliffiella cohnii]WBL14611.1 hypothetical protein O1A01_22495 [Sutcliffiella sp. NC1]
MKRKMMKKVGVILMAFSILGMLGCNTINDKTAELVRKELNEKYNQEFEVIALGARMGTKDNNTVTSYVQDKNGVVFSVVMDTKGTIKSENYLRRKVGTAAGVVLVDELNKHNLESKVNLHVSGGKEIQDADIKLHDYIDSHTPDYFVGKLLLKETNQLTHENVKSAYESTYKQLKNTPLQTDVWVIASEDYDKAVTEFQKNPDVSEEWFDDYKVISKFYIDMSNEGLDSDNEEIKGNM